MKLENNSLLSIDPIHVSRIRLAVGIVFLIGAAFNLLFPNPNSLSTGRWSWIYLSITGTFGPYAYAIFQAIVGSLLIALKKLLPSN